LIKMHMVKDIMNSQIFILANRPKMIHEARI
jgi:hypothetical protein